MAEADHVLVLRLAGPLQSWGSTSQFNRRDTDDQPTKSGVVGLLAAAQGRRRGQPIEDLVGLKMGVRVDQPGTVLRDFHTVSDLTGKPLLSAAVTGSGEQKPTSPKKFTHVTRRFYLQDAVFVVAVAAPTVLLSSLAEAVQRPTFPLALGRRSCVPTQPLVVREDGGQLWHGSLIDVIRIVPWQAGPATRAHHNDTTVSLPVTIDDSIGTEARTDVPETFDPVRRGMSSRRVSQTWVEIASEGTANDNPIGPPHNPFALLGEG